MSWRRRATTMSADAEAEDGPDVDVARLVVDLGVLVRARCRRRGCGRCSSPWLVGRPWRRAALDDPAERFVELRIVHRKNRAAAQLPDEAAEPDRRRASTAARRRASSTAMPCRWNSGAISQNRSMQPRDQHRRSRPSPAVCGCRLTCRDSSTHERHREMHDRMSDDADRIASRSAGGACTTRSPPAGCPTR